MQKQQELNHTILNNQQEKYNIGDIIPQYTPLTN